MISFLKHLFDRAFFPETLIHEKYKAFKNLLDYDNRCHWLMAELEKHRQGEVNVDFCVVRKTADALLTAVSQMIENLDAMAPNAYRLKDVFAGIESAVRPLLAIDAEASVPFVFPLDEIPGDAARLAGNKAANLSQLMTELQLPVPKGFVVTCGAFNHFCEINRLRPRIGTLLSELDIESVASLEEASRQMTSLIMEAPMPVEVHEDMVQGYLRMFGDRNGRVSVSMRSSAVAEDAAFSFAGQYRSVLNVTLENLDQAYKHVIASKYSPWALVYRIRNGLLDEETPMGVLVLEMVDAAASGIVYSRDPVASSSDSVKIYSVWGLGEPLVKGSVAPDVIDISRQEGLRVLKRTQAHRRSKAVLSSGGSIENVDLSPDEMEGISLDDESAQQLAAWALQLEAHFGAPQDIEWCRDRRGRIFLLQSRPLQLEEAAVSSCDLNEIDIANTVLLDGGEKAASGVGAGFVARVLNRSDLDQIRHGTVLVAPDTLPIFVRVISKVKAVVTDAGSVAGHFASIAREWGVPTLVNTQNATSVLRPGESVTVDADRGRVYAGEVKELLRTSCGRGRSLEGSPFQKRLRRILDHVSPLNLVDPKEPSFTAENCRTVHDLVRFAHEKAVEEMFSLAAKGRGRLRHTKKLVSEIPITLYLLDLGNGLRRDATHRKEITPEDVASKPLQALWQGLSHPSIEWSSQLRHFDWKEFDRVSAGIISLDSPLLSSFAAVAQDYLNINIRFGYHFAVIDVLCGEVPRENYITIRFEGGGAGFEGRRLRVLFLAGVLEEHGFEVHAEGDRIEARLQKASSSISEEKLTMIGRLLGFTRLMDMRLTDETEAAGLVGAFLHPAD